MKSFATFYRNSFNFTLPLIEVTRYFNWTDMFIEGDYDIAVCNRILVTFFMVTVEVVHIQLLGTLTGEV